MSTSTDLQARSHSACELCGSGESLQVFDVPPTPDGTADTSVLICAVCQAQADGREPLDSVHWRCLGDSMWSETPAVQVVCWRLLRQLSGETWAQELLDMLYLDEQTQAWAEAVSGAASAPSLAHKDGNGVLLQAGDTVTLVKDLPVKGAGFTAKRGTAVRGISLVADNPGQIEGRVNGQQIVILTEFVKKST